jgi:signal transduction histidine kinase/ActR/RegA family two-component response regulator
VAWLTGPVEPAPPAPATTGELEARRAQLEILAEIQREFAVELNLDRLLHLVVARASRLFGADGVIYLVQGERLLLPRAWSEGALFDRELPFGRGVTGRCAAERRGLLVNDYAASPYATPEYVTQGFRRMLAHPLIVRERLLGVIRLSRLGDDSPPFTPDERGVLESFASQAAIAIENARLHEETERRLGETESLLAVSRALSSTLDFDRLSRQLMREIARIIEADSVGVWKVDHTGEWLDPTIGYHVPPQWLPGIRRLRVSLVQHEFYAEAARTRRAVFARDVATDPRVPEAVRRAAQHRSHLFVPIIAKERVIGGFIAVWWERERDLAARDLALMEAIASQAGAALENLRLFEENRRRVEELSVLHELSRALTGQLDREALLDAVRRLLPRALAVDKFVVLLGDDSAHEVEAVLRVQDGLVDSRSVRRYPRGVGLTSVVLESGRPLRTDDYAAECAGRGITVPDVSGPPHWLGVPLVTGDAVLGALTVSRRAIAFTDAEERLAASIADLAALALRSAQLYGDRTRAYGELRAAQDHLVRTEKLRALGEMASGVAHDFNNLLAAILGRAQLLLRRIDDPRLRQWLQVIERSAIDGAQTVRRLQEFARVRRDEPLVPVDVNDIVRDALEITQSRWREDSLRRGVTIEVRTTLDPVPLVAGDPAELREAMTNLILNAVDAMPSGGVLTLASAAVDGHVEVTVSDSGVGIPAAIRDKIFDPFFTTKGPQGTGLGLSMTYGIVSRHGASIAVTSAEGQGATFRLTFPSLDSRALPPPDSGVETSAQGPRRCLVVDDEETVATVIGDVLESLGHQAVVTTSASEAIARFRAEPFDVVFTDLAMPGLSGWQVAQAVKDVVPHVPVFMVTGFGVTLTAEERRAHGVEAIFSKPLKIEDIVHAMAQVARRRDRADGREGS